MGLEALGLLCTLKDGIEMIQIESSRRTLSSIKRHKQNPRSRKVEDIGADLPVSADGSWDKRYGRTEKGKNSNQDQMVECLGHR